MTNVKEMSKEQLIALVTKMAQKGSNLKVSVKGAISLYGLGKWPVTLYKEQWLKVLAMADEIKAFISANEANLAVKESKK